jgi:hypothetical protein
VSRLQKALQQSIVAYFKDRGIEPAHVSGNNYYYFSPFKSERDPSLCVNVSKYDKEVYKDFSTGDKIGDIVDLVSKLHTVSASDAISIILEGEVRDINQYKPKKKDTPSYIIKDIKPVESRWLMEYMTKTRLISDEVVKNYCKQALVEFPDSKAKRKVHNCIAFENVKHGYELRNPYLKVSTSPKMYSEITNYSARASMITEVWEGFIDWLSYMTYNKYYLPKYRTIILNGLCNFPYVQFKDNEIYHMYVDNDYPAQKELNKLNIKYEDKRNTFEGYKDYNEALVDDFRRTKEISAARQTIRRLCTWQ